jgi:ribosomal protein L11 methyltransferase
LLLTWENRLDWLEFSVTTDREAAEAVAELLTRYSPGGAAIETMMDCLEEDLLTALPPCKVEVKTYLPADGGSDELCRRLEEGLWHLGRVYPIPEPVIRRLKEEDWAEAWKKQYHLLRIGQRTVIVPDWEEYAPAPTEIAIRLEPGLAFGTGLHPTTRLCLEAMERHLTPGCTVLDVGTGSGVLAIAAAKQGARSVLALDADPSAVNVARENVARNGAADVVTIQHGSLPGGEAVPWHYVVDGALDLLDFGAFDLVLVNILARVIMSMAPALAARLEPQGRLIAAGLIASQEQEVVEALRAEGLWVIERTGEKDWVALVARRG